ncbi:MAG: hypothetical protein EBT57_09625 [Verrucomicrobia bacterium]|nr:hypothetical protein [Verrucomicrobiota bacterium]
MRSFLAHAGKKERVEKRLQYCMGRTLACLGLFLSLFPLSASAQPTFVETGSGTNTCRLVLNFPSGEKIVFQHHWNGSSLDAKTLLESIVSSTGGELLVSTNDYLTPFAQIPMTNRNTTGLVVHYQGSYEVPYVNAIRWMGPEGLLGADFQPPNGWWHLWVKGPAHVDQSFAYDGPLPPVELGADSSWFLGENSGLADLTLGNGASVGLVYGSTLAPALSPVIRSVQASGINSFTISFSSIPGCQYQMEMREDLGSGSWAPYGSPIFASSTSTSISIPTDRGAGRAFFRIGLLP